MKQVAGSLRLELSQYRELEAFAAFASDLDAASKAQLDRGQRLVELLKQSQYSPYSVEKQVVAIWLGTGGHLDTVPVSDVQRFEHEFLSHLESRHQGALTTIQVEKKLNDDLLAELDAAVNDFKRGFATSDGSSATGVQAPAEPLEHEGSETVTVNKPAPKK
jgi:F-type H+/Na+-transporting ATPase subunit alpha